MLELDDETPMRFTLKYSGEDLLCSGNASKRKSEKQILRAHFSRQLKKLWAESGVLREVDRTTLPQPKRVRDTFDLPRPLVPITPGRPSIYGFLFDVKYYGSSFIPTITGPMQAQCGLTIRIGRPAKAGSVIFQGGDLDGRLKTLFDALAVPRDEQAIDASDIQQTEYLCLLSDDSLITDLRVDSYFLLEDVDENYLDIDVAVTITAVTPMNGTWVLLFGG